MIEQKIKKNLLEGDADLPLPRFLNGFRIVAHRLECGYICWKIKPSRYDDYFYFVTYTDACNFAKRYSVKHTYNYWHVLKKYNSTYSLGFVSVASNQLSFSL